MIERQPRVLTSGDLARELGVSTQTIKRAIDRGTIVPTFRTASGRARFDHQYVEDLKLRAKEARSAGAVYVVKAITCPKPLKKRTISAVQFAAQIAWKRKYLWPHRKRKPV